MCFRTYVSLLRECIGTNMTSSQRGTYMTAPDFIDLIMKSKQSYVFRLSTLEQHNLFRSNGGQTLS